MTRKKKSEIAKQIYNKIKNFVDAHSIYGSDGDLLDLNSNNYYYYYEEMVGTILFGKRNKYAFIL